MKRLFANLFELWGSYQSQLSTDLYDLNIYSTSGFIMLIVVVLMFIVFYFLLFPKQAKWDTLKHWIIWIMSTSVLATLVVGMYTSGALARNNIRATLPEYIDFLFVVFIWSLVLFFLFSVMFKSLGHPSRTRLPF